MKIENSSHLSFYSFAPKFCGLNLLELSGEVRLCSDKPLPRIPLVLGADLDYLVSGSVIENLKLSEISGSNSPLITGGSGNSGKLPDRDSGGFPKDFWDINSDWFDDPPPPNGDAENDHLDQPEEEDTDDSNHPGEFKPLDIYAYYRPAHSIEPSKTDEAGNNFGIFFRKNHFLRDFKTIESNLSIRQDLSKEEQAYILQRVIVLIIYHVYAHEVCHAWVEDIVSKVDFEMGRKEGPTYKSSLKKYGGFIALEEALCETAGLGWVMDCLSKSRTSMDKSKLSIIKSIYKKWLKNSTKKLIGYKNYCKKTNKAPIKDIFFIGGLCRLISTRYKDKKDTEIIRRAIEDFLGGKINRSAKKYLNPIKIPIPGTPEFAKIAHADWLKFVPRRVEN